MGTQDTTITNESEAMEVWQKAKAVHDGCVSGDWNAPDQAAARVIATALEAAKLEGIQIGNASERADIIAWLRAHEWAGVSEEPYDDAANAIEQGKHRAILTKGDAHD